MNIKELAEQAGASVEADTIIVNGKDADDFVKRFAELVRQDAMEEAATICDGLNYNGIDPLGCAAAIRNRAEEELL